MALDLQPLSQEAILGLSNTEMWMVRIGKDVFGPFETETLRQFSVDHRKTFLSAEATNLHNTKWLPFFDHEEFKPSKLKAKVQGPFWILDKGQKSFPLSKADVEKFIDMGVLSLVDPISVDDGYTWHKIYQVSAFENKFQSAATLPEAPTDFADPEVTHESDDLEVSAIAFKNQGSQASEQTPKLDEFIIKNQSSPSVHQNMKWALPTAIAGVLAVGFVVHSSLEKTPEINTVASESATQKTTPKTNPSRTQKPARSMASLPRHNSSQPEERSALTQPRYEDPYPTHVETHDNDRYPSSDEQPMEHPIDPDALAAEQAQVPEEHSLLDTPQAPEDQGLEAAMNSTPVDNPEPPQDPNYSESSDF